VRKLLKRIEAAFTAVAFAEEGEVETARRVLAEAERDGAAPGGAPGAKAPRGPAPRRSFPRERIARLP
jgi:hypothetical protein